MLVCGVKSQNLLGRSNRSLPSVGTVGGDEIGRKALGVGGGGYFRDVMIYKVEDIQR